MKKLKIVQKYFSLKEKFKIFDEEDNVIFQAQNTIFKFWRNTTLYDATGAQPICTLRAKFSLFFSKFRIIDGDYNGDKEIGAIKERFHLLKGFRKARVTVEGAPNIFFKCGPIHLKAYACDENWKKDKSKVVIAMKKKLSKIRDTYIVEYDDTLVPASLAAIVGVWYDMLNHQENH